MVLHNDKWAKKAKRANERRHGIKSGRGRGNGPATVLQPLDMHRADDETSLASGTDRTASSDDDDSSFEFDSGDEGKTTAERLTRASLPRPVVAEATVRSGEEKSQTRPHSAMPSRQEESSESMKQNKKYARRKLLDNSARYEEPVLDPYLQVVGESACSRCFSFVLTR